MFTIQISCTHCNYQLKKKKKLVELSKFLIGVIILAKMQNAYSKFD